MLNKKILRHLLTAIAVGKPLAKKQPFSANYSAPKTMKSVEIV